MEAPLQRVSSHMQHLPAVKCSRSEAPRQTMVISPSSSGTVNLVEAASLSWCVQIGIPYRFYKLILLRSGLESVKIVIHFPFDARIRIDRQHPFVARPSQPSDSTQ